MTMSSATRRTGFIAILFRYSWRFEQTASAAIAASTKDQHCLKRPPAPNPSPPLPSCSK